MYQRSVSFRMGGPVTPVVKMLMIVNGAVFILQQLMDLIYPGFMESAFGLSHSGFALQFMIWQPFTYMFLHGGWLHIFFNLFTLWMFGGEIENMWGGRKFLRYYIFSGIGAGFFIELMNYYVSSKYGVYPVTIGASGAIYAVLLAYGLTWPNREVLLYFLIPVKIKYLLIGFGLMEFFGTLSSAGGTGGGISHIGHLGGLISGIIMFRSIKNQSRSSSSSKQEIFADRKKKARLKKKQNEIDTRIKAKKIIDQLLEKIARDGMSSLTSEEKKQLDWARKNYYPSNHETMH